MIKRYNPIIEKDEKCSANQKAKQMVLSILENVFYWEENSINESENMTEKERQEVNKYLEQQVRRIHKTLSPEFYS